MENCFEDEFRLIGKEMKKIVEKALSRKEEPLKMKHCNAIVKATYSYKGVAEIWAIAVKQPLLKHKIVTWKFCHLLHNIIREGHSMCCHNLQDNVKFITDLAKFWIFQDPSEPYGMCLGPYTQLLGFKIKFHSQYPQYPGNFEKMNSAIWQIRPGDDLNIIFQVTLELFDYLDHILNAIKLLAATRNVNEKSNDSEYRHAALVPCLKDFRTVYEMASGFMIELHRALQYDKLESHRQKFNNAFENIMCFKKYAYIPLISSAMSGLPDTKPDFQQNRETIQINIVPQAIALNTPSVAHNMEPSAPPICDLEQSVWERSNLIERLQSEAATIRAKLNYFMHVQLDERYIVDFTDEIAALRVKLQQTIIEIQNVMMEKCLLERRNHLFG